MKRSSDYLDRIRKMTLARTILFKAPKNGGQRLNGVNAVFFFEMNPILSKRTDHRISCNLENNHPKSRLNYRNLAGLTEIVLRQNPYAVSKKRFPNGKNRPHLAFAPGATLRRP
jgi:hypothetical protein